MLILDEPSAALDAEAELDFYRRLETLAPHHTVIVVTHRLSAAQMMDRIAVLDGGALVQVGSHQALIDQGGRYAELFALQAQPYRSRPGHTEVAPSV